MRYIGNKSRLLGRIEACARGLGFRRGTVCDLFAGTAVVGRHFRSLGNRVLATDLMHSSHVFQKLFLELRRLPSFDGLRKLGVLRHPPAPESRVGGGSALPGDPTALLAVLGYLERGVPPRSGLLTRQFSPDGRPGRRFFRPGRARSLDAMLLELRAWREEGRIEPLELALLLACVIDAADRIANISGTYGAFLKTWQSSCGRKIELDLPRLVCGPSGKAHRKDAFAWLPGVEADLLYIDPPYNRRQYPANFHVPEVVARIPYEADLDALEASLYGKTGLIPWKKQASSLCRPAGTACREAFRALLLSTSIPRVVISYSEEGIIDRSEFVEMLAEYAGTPRARLGRALTRVAYPRFRSDADGRVARNGAVRRYRILPGRDRNEVHEWLFHVARSKVVRPRRRTVPLARAPVRSRAPAAGRA